MRKRDGAELLADWIVTINPFLEVWQPYNLEEFFRGLYSGANSR